MNDSFFGQLIVRIAFDIAENDILIGLDQIRIIKMQKLNRILLDFNDVPQALEHLHPVVSHNERFAGARDGVVVLKQS